MEIIIEYEATNVSRIKNFERNSVAYFRFRFPMTINRQKQLTVALYTEVQRNNGTK